VIVLDQTNSPPSLVSNASDYNQLGEYKVRVSTTLTMKNNSANKKEGIEEITVTIDYCKTEDFYLTTEAVSVTNRQLGPL
jgi:hypothetical protein